MCDRSSMIWFLLYPPANPGNLGIPHDHHARARSFPPSSSRYTPPPTHQLSFLSPMCAALPPTLSLFITHVSVHYYHMLKLLLRVIIVVTCYHSYHIISLFTYHSCERAQGCYHLFSFFSSTPPRRAIANPPTHHHIPNDAAAADVGWLMYTKHLLLYYCCSNSLFSTHKTKHTNTCVGCVWLVG